MFQVRVQDQGSVLVKRLQKSQSSGFIQLDNLDLNIFPNEVPNIAELRFDSQKWWDIIPITKLDLSNNKIASIPEEIVNLNDLVSFRMQNNVLESLPDSLFLIQTLKSVDLVNNRLREVPPSIIKCSSLVEINLRHNQIEVLPVHYGGLYNLEILDLSENSIKVFRLSDRDLPRLKRLDLSQNQINSLDSNLGSLSELEFLNLSKNRISDLPPDVFGNMKNLKLLDLKENKLVTFEEFPHSTKLDSVILAFNQLKNVRNFVSVPNLTVLDLKNNKLERLDPALGLLKELKTLDLSNNDLADIPNEIGFMTKLVRINLEGNALKCIRSSVRFAGTEALKKYVRERTDTAQTGAEIVKDFNKVSKIDVWDQFIKDFLVSGKELAVVGQNIPTIHDKFCNLNIVVLDLSNNNIDEINPNLVRLSHLQKLRLNSNKIVQFDGRILAQFQNLEELELRNNKLTYLLEDLTSQGYGPFLENLKHLDISQNRFDRIPTFVTYLQRLRVLILAYNALTSIEGLFVPELRMLQTLDVSNNKIEKISDDVFILENLQHLNCESNNISNFPTILGCMETLANLQVYGNPIKNIRKEIITKGSKLILEYLKTRHPNPPPPSQKKPERQKQQKPGSRMQDEEEEDDRRMYKVTEVNPQRANPQETRGQPGQQRAPMNYQPERYQPNPYGEERKAVNDQNNQATSQIHNEIKALDAAIKQIEHELQENFTLSTTMIMKKKKEINAIRSKKNTLLQELGAI